MENKTTKLSEDLNLTDSKVLFCGNFHHLLDDKGRVSLPAAFRSFLEEKNEDSIVLTNYLCDGARCLDGYTLSAWKIFQNKLSEKSRFDPQLRQLENFYLARSSMCAVDSSGRINIPTHLRTYAGLTKEVVFASALHGFRVWDSKVWEMIFREAETALLQNPSLFVGVDR
jgi:MraZ protein